MRLSQILFLSLFVTSLAWAEDGELAKLHSKHLKVRLSEIDTNSVTLTIRHPSIKQIEIVKIADPARLVIDLAKFKLENSRPITPAENKFVSKIRLGSHDDKIRLVLDLKEPPTITFQVSESTNTISITLKNTAFIEPSSSPTPSPAVTTPTPSPVASASASPPTAIAVKVLEVVRAPSPSASTTSAPPPTISPSPSPSSSMSPAPATSASSVIKGGLLVEKLAFESLSSGLNVIRLTLSKKTAYSLSQINDSKYKLSVAETQASAQALLPQFPPYDFYGIDYINPTQAGQIYDLEIGVASGTKLTTYARGNDILIKAVPP